MAVKKIALSANIEAFTDNNFIYVDKTEQIYRLIDLYPRVFISRPRRFGKSLTLNTIATLFEKGVDPYFKGTWIYDKWQERQYPVLHLSFIDYSQQRVELLKQSLCSEFKEFAHKQGITGYTDSTEPNDLVRSILNSAPDGWQFVLLIDEYDAPMTAHINNKELYDRFQLCLREFYGALKDKKQIKFLAITGVTRLKDVSIFSVGSDIVDMSYEHICSQLIGFTRDEIKKFYQDYLRLGAAYAQHKEPEQVSAEDIEILLDDMARHYDGYCFDNKYRLKVFSTWSVNSFLQTIAAKKRVAFNNYWYDAGGLPTILANYLKSHGTAVLKSYLQLLDEGQEHCISLSVNRFKNPTTLVGIDENILMCQTGYLTLHSPLGSTGQVQLGFANQETATSLAHSLSELLFPEDISNHARHVRRTLEEGSAEEIAELLKETLAAVPYDHFPLKNEMLLRALIQFFIQIYCDNVRAEQHNHNGRSDVIACFEHRVLVLELKYSQDGSNQDKLLEEAVNQIKDHDYGRENLDGRELIRLALVYSAQPGRRGVMAYQSV